MQTFKLTLLALPLVGACMMAALIWKSLFIVAPLTEGMYLWLVVLLLPFGLAFLSNWRYARTSNKLCQGIGVLHSILLGMPAVIGFVGNWNGEIFALLPIYLWPVTAVMTLTGIGADALSSKYRRNQIDQKIP
jgi:hypothetical protein